MREVLYTKYNSKRRPIYQLSTSIVRDGEKQFAVKKAIQPRAQQHLMNLIENRKKLETLYDDIKVVDCKQKDEAIEFPFVEGRHLLDDIDFANATLEEIIEQMKNGLKRISFYKDEMICKFKMTEAFAEIFGECTPGESEEAIRIANIDALFPNFVILEDEKLCCIDYEWVLDFPVPLKYITFRNIYYFYHDNELHLKKWIEKEAFYKEFGYSEEDIQLYSEMEEAFQQHVHGVNWEYVYLERYKKDTMIWAAMEADMQNGKVYPILTQQVAELKEEVQKWIDIAEKQQVHMENMRRAIRNPFYGLYWLGKKIVKKLTGK